MAATERGLRMGVGETIGVEEEFHLVDPDSHGLAHRPGLAAAPDERISAELKTSQLETTTPVCRTLAEVRAELVRARRDAAALAAGADALLLPTGTHPFGSWRQQQVTRRPRYDAIVERFGMLALQQDVCGCHVHVGVPDLDTAVAVLDRVRPYLPVLLALTGSSPFHDDLDTGYDSFRSQWLAQWPLAGPPDRFGSARAYRAVVRRLVETGVADDESHLFWDVRPSHRYPTLEFRIADVCTSVDDAVLHAGLARSLVRTLARWAEDGRPASRIRPEVLRSARWRAARFGIGERLLDPRTQALVPAADAVGSLLADLRPDLTAHGEWDELAGLAGRLPVRGTSAGCQRRIAAGHGRRGVAAALAIRPGRPAVLRRATSAAAT